jgi:hypothetical protein
MFDFIKKRFVVAEVDGIKFYREKSLQNYLDWRDERDALRRSRVGKFLYTFEIPWYQKMDISDAKIILEQNGCFDYSIKENGSFITVKYWAKECLLRWKAK